MLAARKENILARLWADPAIRSALFMFIVLRVISALVAYWIVSFSPPLINYAEQPYIYNIYPEVFTTQGIMRPWLEPWYRWDTGWYLHIAYKGYSATDGSIIFPPLYPFTIKLLALFTGDYLLAGLLVSNICCFIMLVLLYKLVTAEFNPATARLTLLLTVTFPAAFYFVAAYTESLYMALLLGSWFATTKRHYWLAGILASLSALTRSQGWVLALPLGYIIYVQHLNLPQTARNYLSNPIPLLRPLPAVIGGPLGAATYLFGMQFAGLGSVNEAYESPVWKTEVLMPWESLFNALQVIVQGTARSHDIANIAAFIFAVSLSIVVTIKLKPPYWLYIWPTVGFILLRGHYLIQLHGMVRYTLYLFPVFIVLALLLQRNTPVTRTVRLVYLVVGFALQILLITYFAAWVWVS